MRTLLALSIPLLAISSPAPAATEWAKGIEYTTDWDTAIRATRESGKMLFIYNGWEREGI